MCESVFVKPTRLDFFAAYDYLGADELTEKRIIMDKQAMQRVIARISYEVIERNKGVDDLCIIGILSRGAEIAERIKQKIYEVEKVSLDVGKLDITNFRDDKVSPKSVDKTEVNFSIHDKKILLVDDVIFTGRTVRAAIDAIMTIGRPKQIELAVLIDRGHRELPIRADFVGKNLPTSRDEKVRVCVEGIDGEENAAIIKEESK